MQFTFKNALKVLSVPFSLFVIYISLLLVWELIGLPPKEELVKDLITFVNQYGLIIVFFAAIIEGILLVGNYFPGGTVIFLGVIAAAGNIPQAIAVVAVASISFFISHTINYYLGKYGWYKLFVKFGLKSPLDSMKRKLTRHVFSAILSSYWLPNLAAICSTTAGIIQVPFRRFLIQSAIGIVGWNIFWGIFVYITGEALLKLNVVYVLGIFGMWCVLILGKVFIFDKKFDVEIKPPIQDLPKVD